MKFVRMPDRSWLTLLLEQKHTNVRVVVGNLPTRAQIFHDGLYVIVEIQKLRKPNLVKNQKCVLDVPLKDINVHVAEMRGLDAVVQPNRTIIR